MADPSHGDSHPPPPTYQEALDDSSLRESNVRDDGRIDVDLNSRLSRTLYRMVKPPPPYEKDTGAVSEKDVLAAGAEYTVRLNIVIQVVGSRGDVQPFIALGCALQRYGHRIRLATHEKFRAFVEDSGLEFYAIGGNPEDLMAYMVKNPGLMPSMKTLRAGEIARKREMVAEMLEGCWNSCVAPDPTDGHAAPFVADAIIANPPSFAHMHCAEALGIPVHIVFTMPWTGTGAFAHPLANLRGSSGDAKLANYMTYVLVEFLTWQGLGDVINAWREKLGLEYVSPTQGPMLAETLKIPHTYCWSPALIPKPADWAGHIDVSGFFFREMPKYTPSEDLQSFLEAGPPPIYVGFGSIVVEDVARFSSAIIDAITECGVRAIISPGWSRLQVPEDRPDIFCLEECPHEWLFQHVSTVIHHGGAGTTAIGLREARPTIIVPFFGDQPFWGKMVADAGSGPAPIPQRQINAERLAEAIRFCEESDVRDAAARLSAQIKQEDGVEAAVRSFHANLPSTKLQCDILPDQPASWQLKLGGRRAKISRVAVEVLIRDTGLNAKNLKPYSPNPIVITNRHWDPATGTASSLVSTATGMVDGATGIFLKPRQEYLRGRSQSSGLTIRSAPGSASTSRVRLPQETSKDNMSKYDDKQDEQKGFAPVRAATDSSALSESGTQASSSSTTSKPDHNVAGSMALASGRSLGKFFSSFSKGMLMDMPLAATEGFRSMPRLWGEEVKHYGDVTDWQSGGVVAGKTLVQGMSDGFRDVVMHPVKGARTGGALGAAKGLATGTGSLLSNTMSASLGLVAYPGQGIAKSLHTLMHSSTAKQVAEVRHEEGRWKVERLSEVQRFAIVDAYHDLQRKN